MPIVPLKQNDKEELVRTCKARGEQIRKDSLVLERQILILSDEYRELQKLFIKEFWGVEPGTIVKDPRGKLHKVTSVDIRQWGATWDKVTDRPWITGNPMRADGAYGTSERHLYENWMLVDE